MGQLGPPVGALDELQISLVPLLQALQQQLVLRPLQLQLLHLGLQLCQPGLTLQKVSLELSSAALKLHPCSQELPLVFYAWQQAPCQGLWEQGLQERARDVPG